MSLFPVANFARALEKGEHKSGNTSIDVLRCLFPFVNRAQEQGLGRHYSCCGKYWTQALEDGAENEHLSRTSVFRNREIEGTYTRTVRTLPSLRSTGSIAFERILSTEIEQVRLWHSPDVDPSVLGLLQGKAHQAHQAQRGRGLGKTRQAGLSPGTGIPAICALI